MQTRLVLSIGINDLLWGQLLLCVGINLGQVPLCTMYWRSVHPHLLAHSGKGCRFCFVCRTTSSPMLYHQLVL